MRKKIEIDIILRDGENATYSTHEVIRGRVVLNSAEDAVLDDLRITLKGKASIRLKRPLDLAMVAGYLVGEHTFLRMSAPVSSPVLLQGRSARGVISYSIPFNFTVPQNLLQYACMHNTKDDQSVKTAHLLLPPSLGKFKRAGILVHDLGPETTTVTYAVYASVRRFTPDLTPVLIEKAVRVRICPRREEVPPILVRRDDPYYKLREEKAVYKGCLKLGKVAGRLVAQTSQPSSLKLPCPHTDTGSLPIVMSTVNLRFYPAADGERPPKLKLITYKLHSSTFSGAAPYESLPTQSECHVDISLLSFG
ncbi:hypothetical protein A1O7_06984 [Cladophialophora yegresii CBS 114405]|uniref:Arrestin-like N-terminal domain-containing protein n=1 Tax=Cladophialophora yegresii CBS 114405 TaxID=1182544 RepID=W9VUD8_9EURO|nr:uncharacterized protein A1O7_06984 [Cladophialophora yegresii CBS 114405]EXJ56640.1 hypothetical protein A1O7_06984 [Cladophialophora yegresii CBS 114405]